MLNLKQRLKELTRRHGSSGLVTSPTHLRQPEGKVLVSYLEHVLSWAENDDRFRGHSNNWESREIIRIFNRLGYTVDAISWGNHTFVPSQKYDAVFDIHLNLQRLSNLLPPETKKILHLTGSYPLYQNSAELRRIEELERRKGRSCSPRRVVPHTELALRSLELADACTLIGNRHTLQTYPPDVRGKIRLVPVSASQLQYVKERADLVPPAREFLFFNGSGAVHKGLDLVLEVFSRHRDLTLHVVGNYDGEADFFEIYADELRGAPNIRYHGFLLPDAPAFKEVVARAFCFISPSCSEAVSTAAATCLQIGLFPVISRDCGVTLPAGAGITLEQCSLQEIEQAVLASYGMDEHRLKEEIVKCQEDALHHYSREAFSTEMTRALTAIMGKAGA